MPVSRLHVLASLCSTLALPAQGPELLFTVSQPEQTLTGSGGTALGNVFPNEILGLHVWPCPRIAEKWAPRSCFATMAGDEDGDDSYSEPALFAAIDALLPPIRSATGIVNQRTIYFSPKVAMGTTISGAPGLRPGDVGRIVRTAIGDGQVEHFVRAEQIQIALGLPPLPVVIDVDAVAASPNLGVFLSLDGDHAVDPCGGPTLLRDGDVFVIPPSALTWGGVGTVATVVPNSAVIVWTEAQIDAMVANATVTDRNGVCVAAAIDLEALEIDHAAGPAAALPACSGGIAQIPHLLFSTESLTGGAVLTTAGGGTIHNGGCAPLGTTCGFGPTLGNQVGLLPPTAAVGIASHVNALAATRVFRFVAEAAVPQIPVFTPAQIDFASPAPLTWVFTTFAPGGAGAIAPATSFPWTVLGFPDYWAPPFFMGLIGTGAGFGTYTSPPIPFPCDLVWFGVTITGGGSIEVSTPTMVEVF